jgi:hypothetical protein
MSDEKGYKRAVSIYFRNKRIDELFAEKTSGLGVRQTKFIMGLIEKDLADPQLSPSPIATFALNKPFTSFEPFLLDGILAFPELDMAPPKIKKNIMEVIDGKVMEAACKHLSKRMDKIGGRYFVVIKLNVDVGYSIEDTGDHNNLKGHFVCRCALFEVTERLWNNYGGLYDLTKVRYLKYFDLIRGKIKNNLLALLFERDKNTDMVGGFFIPVSNAPMDFPKKLTDYGFKETPHVNVFIKLMGVDQHKNIERFSLTKIGKSDGSATFMKGSRIKL